MGGGGRMNRVEERNINRAPSDKPPFTVGQLKKAVPPHCFERSVRKSGGYLLVDLTVVIFLYSCSTWIEKIEGPLAWPLWIAYCIAQGSVCTGVWVIAHECGHHAFSDHQWLDDSVGFVLHSCLLVPYFSWKYSHRRHHSNTGSVERDEVFVPKSRGELGFMTELQKYALGRLLIIASTLIVGWPLYLVMNASGRKYERYASHFHMNSPIFNNREKMFIFISDVGLVVVGYGLYTLGSVYGFLWLLKVYGVPLLLVNSALVTITYLQHTHPSLPHYKGEEWEWLRGALSTMDRDYGIFNTIFHHITDTHVAHHMFSTMPHYHAEEATKVLKPILGRYYQCDRTPVFTALWREFRECLYVEADAGSSEGVLWYNR